MAFMEPQSLRPLPRYHYSPTYRGAPTDVHGKIAESLYAPKSGTFGSALKTLEDVLTVGERLSGTALYKTRKTAGLGKIEYLEDKIAQGKGWKISPSQALGIAEFGEDKFELLSPSTWSMAGGARGTFAFGADIVLDPVTWVTVGVGGLAKIGAKGGVKIAGKAFLARGGTRVGVKGTEFLEAAAKSGVPRKAAERNLISYMKTSPEARAWSLSGGERMIRFGTRAHHIDLMRTSRITGPAGQMWRKSPFLGSRTRAWDMLNVGLGSRYYRFTQAMGLGAERPFQQYHRESEVATAMMRKELADVAVGVPYGSEDIIRRAMELGAQAPAAEARAAKQYATISKKWWTEARGAGIIGEEQYLEKYVYHMATPEFKKWMGERKGLSFDPNIPMPEYAKMLGSTKGRTAFGDIDAINEFFMKLGAPKALETDIYKIMLARGTAHTKAMAYAKLEQRAVTKWGMAAAGTFAPKYTMRTSMPAPIMIDEAISGLRPAAAAKMRRGLLKEMWELPVPEHIMGMGMGGISPAQAGKEIRKIREEMAWGKIATKSQEMAIKTYTSLIAKEPSYARRASYESERYGAELSLSRILKNIEQQQSRFGMLPAYKEVFAYGKAGMADVRQRAFDIPDAALMSDAERIVKTRAAEIAEYEKKMFVMKELRPDPARMFGGKTFHLLKRSTGEEVYLPIPVLEELQRPAARYGEGVVGDIMKEWQKRESQMKAGMTVAWPAFFARNIQGGIFQNILAGVGIKGYTRAFDMLARTSDYWGARQLRKYIDLPETKAYDVPYRGKMTAREMRDLMEQEQVIQVTGRMDVPLDTRVSPIKPGAQHKMWNWLTSKYPQTGMTGTEAIVRAPLFMHEMFAGKTVRAAEEQVGKFHFRYGAGEMTDFENLVMKRLFPFWTWTRHNIRLQTEMATTQPGTYATLMKAQRRAVPEEDRARMKDWMRSRLGFTAGETFVAIDLPVGELPILYGREDVAFGLSPMIKAPIGLIMQRDVMAGRPITGDTNMELAKANIAFAMTSFLPRFGHTQRELGKTLAGERPLSWTVAHQFGGVGIYEMPTASVHTGMTMMPRMPTAVRKMGVTQEKWTEYQMASGWTPSMTDVSRVETWQQHGGVCSVCGKPCSPSHPCRSQLIVPVEMGGTYSPDNTALVCSSCSGTFRRDIAPMMGQSVHGTQVPTEYRTSFTDGDRDRIYGVIDSYMSDASLVE